MIEGVVPQSVARHGTSLLKAMLKWLSPGELEQRRDIGGSLRKVTHDMNETGVTFMWICYINI